MRHNRWRNVDCRRNAKPTISPIPGVGPSMSGGGWGVGGDRIETINSRSHSRRATINLRTFARATINLRKTSPALLRWISQLPVCLVGCWCSLHFCCEYSGLGETCHAISGFGETLGCSLTAKRPARGGIWVLLLAQATRPGPGPQGGGRKEIG
jgi:hypothetical protein